MGARVGSYTRATTCSTWKMSRAMRAATMLALSEVVTAARPWAWSMPARLSESWSRASPWTVRPLKPGPRRSKDCRLVSMTVTWWPLAEMEWASSTPTRPQPTMRMFSRLAGCGCGWTSVCECAFDTGASVFEPIRHVGHHHAAPEEQGQPDDQGRLDVQDVVPPLRCQEVRHDDGDDVVLLAGVDLVEIGDERVHDRAVVGGQHHQPDAVAPAVPLFDDLGRGRRVGL